MLVIYQCHMNYSKILETVRIPLFSIKIYIYIYYQTNKLKHAVLLTE